MKTMKTAKTKTENVVTLKAGDGVWVEVRKPDGTKVRLRIQSVSEDGAANIEMDLPEGVPVELHGAEGGAKKKAKARRLPPAGRELATKLGVAGAKRKG